jgi:hypothetical protein
MAERVTGPQQVDRPAAVSDFHRPGSYHVQMIQRLGVRGHDHRAGGEVLDLDLSRQPREVACAERIERRL